MLENIKNYLRIYDNSDDRMLQEMIQEALVYIESCVGKKAVMNPMNMELVNLLTKKIVSHLYENRGLNIEGNFKRDMVVTTILDKLAGDSDV